MTHYQWILARSILTVTVGFCKKALQFFVRKINHIRQFEKVYGMRTIITIVKADYCLMSQLLLNILSNVTLPPYPSFFVHFKHTFVTHEILSIDDFDIFACYRDLWKTASEKKNAVRQGIISTDGCMTNCIKLRINAGDKSAGVAQDKAIADAYGNKFIIPLDFEMLDSAAPYY